MRSASCAAQLAIDAREGTIAWSDDDTARVGFKRGTDATKFVTVGDNPLTVSIDVARSVIYVAERSGRIVQVSMVDDSVKVLATGLDEPYGVDHDRDAVYFTTRGQVWKVAKPVQ